jgi:4-hydroxy-tetrahydrodipicolinate synthase
MRLAGAFTALVTPFRNGQIDEEGYREFIEWQIEEGIDGHGALGTTGESATLSHAEHRAAIEICIDQVKGRVPVIAGAGSNNTREAISLAGFAKDAGADAVLLIAPYYNKPSQAGLFAHFKAVNDAVSIPAIVYNVPGRTGVNVVPATMARLYAELPHVVGVKEATGDLVQVSDILEQCDDDFVLLSGDDFTLLPTLAPGRPGSSPWSPMSRRRMWRPCATPISRATRNGQGAALPPGPPVRAWLSGTQPRPGQAGRGAGAQDLAETAPAPGAHPAANQRSCAGWLAEAGWAAPAEEATAAFPRGS